MFRHIGIVVKNMITQKEFYEKILGLEIYYDEIEKGSFLEEIVGEKGVEAHIVKLGKENHTMVELLDFNRGEITTFKKLIQSGYTHFALTVTQLEEKYSYMKKGGISFISPPKLNTEKNALVCFCQDPEGNFIEMVEII